MPILESLFRSIKNLELRRPYDLPLRMWFGVEIDGIIDTAFQNVRGLSANLEQRKIREVNRNYPVTRGDGFEHEPIVLTKGMVPVTSFLFDWWEEVVYWETIHAVKRMESVGWSFETRHGGKRDYRRSCSIVHLMPIKGALIEVKRWNIYNAYPIRFEVSDLDSQNGEVVVNILTLEYEGLPELVRI